ncbi:ATP-binding cassette domain-containing protein [Proteus vulgaris]|uniref:ATP-binding cassette domain-containing protein n=1 Tax=Proteus vulgaris TaxID=585 RepID=UPI0034DD9CB6
MSFYYQNNTPPILRNISLQIKKHEIIGIVGTSGSGKSTLARLITGLYTPQLGCIKLDNIPLPQLHLNAVESTNWFCTTRKLFISFDDF